MVRLKTQTRETHPPRTRLSWRSLEYLSPVVIENVSPEVDAGRFPIKRVVGESVDVTACVHVYGHNALSVVLLYHHESEEAWNEAKMYLENKGLDLWRGQFYTLQLGEYEYTIKAWIDTFGNWKHNTQKKLQAGQDISVELLEGATMLEAVLLQVKGESKEQLTNYITLMRRSDNNGAISLLADYKLQEVIYSHQSRQKVCQYHHTLKVRVDPIRARFGAWYEMFPRSPVANSAASTKHGTFKDVIARLPYIKDLGFDVLYLPPIHPIGKTGRKGANNVLLCQRDDPGSPWAIGSKEGGHTAIHPQLGTLDDFDTLVAEANKNHIDIALDFAIQCSPDHPYVHEHPEWFYHRPDGSIRYAENPPKKYEDIYPLDFECPHWQELWHEMLQVVFFWINHGIKLFRVDNPHTKPYQFWNYLIAEVKRLHPEVIFLSEAFTRPPTMKYLAKCGFTQSYTYFTWRNTKQELKDYLTELTQSELAEYLRPNLFANTPDILHAYLQQGGRPAFLIRLALAATMGASYGIYGPPFELCVNEALPGTEEYKDSEKYQLRNWHLDEPTSIAGFISRVNQIRRDNPALHFSRNLKFVDVDNEQIIAYIKANLDLSNIVLTTVNLDHSHVQAGWVNMPVHEFGLGDHYQVHDLLSDNQYTWHGAFNFVELDPDKCPAHIFRVIRLDQDSDHFRRAL